MAAASNNGWKTCSRGHKFRGPGCTVCWKGNKKSARRANRPPKTSHVSRTGAVRLSSG